MRKIFIVSTKANGSIKVHQSEASTWGDLVKELKGLDDGQYDPDGMRAVDAVNAVEFLDVSSTLPAGDFTLSLQPVKVKAGAYQQYDLEYSVEDIPNLGYAQLKAELKSIKAQSVEHEDDISDLIGNYTQMSTDNLKAKLKEVYNKVSVPAPVASQDNGSMDQINTLFNEVKNAISVVTDRVLELELKFNIVNSHNLPIYEKKAKDLHAKISKLVSK